MPGFALLLGLSATTASAAPPAKPNFRACPDAWPPATPPQQALSARRAVILFGDDWGYGDIGANWQPAEGQPPVDQWDPKFPKGPDVTPFIDKLAASGLRFTDFHAGASVCTPSRASLLTGRYGLRTGITHNVGPASRGGLPTGEITLAAQ